MKITKNNYFDPDIAKRYMTASFIKQMLTCEAQAIAELSGLWKRPASNSLLVGSYVDAAFESVRAFSNFKAQHPEILKKDGTLKAEYSQADQMIERGRKDPVFMKYMRGQHQKILVGEIGGYPFKAKLDVYVSGERIVDLKTTKSMEPVYLPGQGRVSFAEAWKWPLQMAIYQRLEGNRLPCYLAVITKEDPPDIDVIEISQDTLDAEIDLLMEKLPRYDAIRQGIIEPERCGRCAFCRETHRIIEPTPLDEYEFMD